MRGNSFNNRIVRLRKAVCMFLFCLLSWSIVFSRESDKKTDNFKNKKDIPLKIDIKESEKEKQQKNYSRSMPGEITFKTGAVIVGKIEKPQVMIVIPKEKPETDSIVFDHSFIKEILKPLQVNAAMDIDGR